MANSLQFHCVNEHKCCIAAGIARRLDMCTFCCISRCLCVNTLLRMGLKRETCLWGLLLDELWIQALRDVLFDSLNTSN